MFVFCIKPRIIFDLNNKAGESLSLMTEVKKSKCKILLYRNDLHGCLSKIISEQDGWAYNCMNALGLFPV